VEENHPVWTGWCVVTTKVN